MALKIFCSYAHKDVKRFIELKKHLSPLQRRGLIELWCDYDISAGAEWEGELGKNINNAQIILLLISADFMASDYCYGNSVKKALERHERGDARLIPIILRPVNWHYSPLSKLQALPKSGKAVTEWPNQDRAFEDITKDIAKVVEELSAHEILTASHKAEFIDIFEYLSTQRSAQNNYAFRLSNGRKIDRDMVEFVMRNTDRGDCYCLDTQTGQVIRSSEIDEISDKSEEELDDGSRYILIDTRITSYEVYQWMKDFVTQIILPKDKQFSDVLFNELEKPKPFRRFKEALDKKWVQAWYDWEDYHFIEAMNEWFESLPETIRGG